MRDTSVPLTRVAVRDTDRHHRSAAERTGRIGRLRRGKPSVSERRAGADDARANRADRDLEAARGGPGERRSDPDRLRVTADGCTRRDRRLDEPPFLERA